MITNYLILNLCILGVVKLPESSDKDEKQSNDASKAKHSSTSNSDLKPISVGEICYSSLKADHLNPQFYLRLIPTIEFKKKRIPFDLVISMVEGLKEYISIKSDLLHNELEDYSEDISKFNLDAERLLHNNDILEGENEICIIHRILMMEHLSKYLLWNITRIIPGSILWKFMSTEVKIKRILFNLELLLCLKISVEYEKYIRLQLAEYYKKQKYTEFDLFLQEIVYKLREILHNKILFNTVLVPIESLNYLLASIVNDIMFANVRHVIAKLIINLTLCRNYNKRYINKYKSRKIFYEDYYRKLDLTKISISARNSLKEWIDGLHS